MPRGVRALVFVLSFLLVLSLIGNYLLMRERKAGKADCEIVLTAPEPPKGEDVASKAEDVAPKAEEAPMVEEQNGSKSKKEAALNLQYAFFFGTNHVELFFESPCVSLMGARVIVEPGVPKLVKNVYPGEIDLSGEFEPNVVYSIVVKIGDKTTGVVLTAPDHPTSLDFKTSGRLFPLYNDFWNLPVGAENINGQAKVKVYQAYPERALEFLKRPYDENFSRVMSESTLPVGKIRNKEQQVCLNLEDVGIPRKPGLYRMELFEDCEAWRTSDRTFIVTDLGVIATYANDEVAVAVRSLKDGSPIANARVQIFSKKLWEYCHEDTDENGFCRLPLFNTKEKEDSLEYLVVTKGEDRVYAYLERSGRVESESKTMVFTERGICRPGENIRVFASMRDSELRSQGGVPLSFVIVDPKGNEICHEDVTGDVEGLYEYECAIPQDALTGDYRVVARMPGDKGVVKEFGSSHFLVGEYVPDQMKMSFDCARKEAEDVIDCSGKVEYYFGSAVGNAQVALKAYGACDRFSPKGFEDYTFGYSNDSWHFRQEALATTNKDGVFSCELDMAEALTQIGTPVRIALEATTTPSAGGRSVTAHQVIRVHNAEYYLGGLKEDAESKECRVRLVGVSPDGKEVSLENRGLKYTLSNHRWNYVLKQTNGNYERTWEHEVREISKGEVTLTDGELIFGDEIGRGEFQLVVRNADDTPILDMSFWHWGGESGARLKDPTRLVFELDKENYLPGESALVSFESPMDGNGIVMAGLNHLAAPMAFPVKVGRNEVSIPIPADLNNGDWFAAVAVACRKDTASDPMLFKGMVTLPVRQDSHRMKVTVEVPEESKPSTDMEVVVNLKDSTGAPVAGEAILWGVDMGILSLTDYKTPDIFGFFFGGQENPLSIGDNYSMLYPVVNAGTEKIGGGDALAKYRGNMKESLAAPAIFHLGIVKSDANGVARATVRLPEHTGAMRVMAVACDKERTGCGDAEVILRRDASIILTVPRVVSPGDEFSISLQGFNHNLEKGTAQWSVSMKGDATLDCESGDFLLEKGGDASRSLRVKTGNTEGRIGFVCRMTLEGAEAICGANVVVRSAVPPVETFNVVEIAPGESKELSVGKFGSIELGSAALAVTGSLQWLGNYPYGCLEQVTSGAFPMLSIQNLVDAGVLPESYAIAAKTTVKNALRDLSTKRLWNNWMSMWSGGRDPWIDGSLFAYLFMFEAEKAGYGIDAKWRQAIAGNLRSYLNSTENSVQSRAFANYILSYVEPKVAYRYLKLLPEKVSPKISANEEKNLDLSRYCDGFSGFLIAMTRIRSGYAAEGVRDLQKILQEDFLAGHAPFVGFDSDIRRAGIALWMLCDVLPEDPSVEKIYQYIMSRRNAAGHWGTTQENAWAALGLSRYISLRKMTGGVSGVIVNGSNETEFSKPVRLTGEKKVTVKNTGSTVLTAYVRDREIPSEIQATEKGIQVKKEFLDIDGNPVTEFKRGQLVFVKVRVSFSDAIDLGNYVICDLLPGCMEIEDENLVTRSRALSPASSKIFPGLHLSFLEKRFDRFLGFGDVNYLAFQKGKFEGFVTYKARVVTSGDFAVPPVSVESMYHPEFQAVAPFEKARITVE